MKSLHPHPSPLLPQEATDLISLNKALPGPILAVEGDFVPTAHLAKSGDIVVVTIGEPNYRPLIGGSQGCC